jgi:hypothetical protein
VCKISTMINILSKNAFQLINCFFKAAGRPMRVRHATLDVGLDDGVPDCLPEEAGLSGVLVSADSKFALPTWPITIMLTADLLFLSLQDSTSGLRKATFQAASSSGMKLSTLDWRPCQLILLKHTNCMPLSTCFSQYEHWKSKDARLYRTSTQR